MGSKKFIIIVLALSSSLGIGQEVQMLTKQDPQQLRYLSSDSKVTYYQLKNALYLSTGFKVSKIREGESNDSFLVHSSVEKKRILVEQTNSKQSTNLINSLHKIFVLDFAQIESQYIGDGVQAQLHHFDSWVSYYHPLLRTIYLVSAQNVDKKITIKLNNKVSPYFRPSIAMINDDDVYYTDINLDGIEGVLKLNLKNNEKSVITKASSPLDKFEICSNSQYLYLGKFPYQTGKPKSSIAQINLKDKTEKIIYQGESFDLGKMICQVDEEFLFFIKDTTIYQDKSDFNLPYYYDAFSIHAKTGALKQRSSLKSLHQMVAMDGHIVAIHRGDFYLIHGKAYSLGEKP